MKLDLRDLECPEPIIKVKEKLNSIKIGESFEAVVNTLPPQENISRFLKTNDVPFEMSRNGKEVLFKITKNKDIQEQDLSVYNCGLPTNATKILYLNDDRAGSGEVGPSLLAKFLGSILNLSNKPTKIFIVNNGVKMTTDRSHPCYAVLKELEDKGIEIFTCGSCLESYKLVDKLSIGKMTNALEIMENLTKFEVISL